MSEKEKAGLLELTRKKYSDQAIWYLNGFWKSGAEAEAENIWKFSHGFVSLDTRKKEGNELDEFWSHKFLESLGETLTVIQLRERLRKIDLDANGKMSLLEYLMFKYSKAIPEVLNAPQGDPVLIEKAQREFQAVQAALEDVQQQLEQQKKAEDEQRQKLAEQKKRLTEQKRAEDEVKRAEEEQAAAVHELKSQEDAYQKAVQDLTRKSEHGDSIVAKNKAKQELAQLKQENPLPLRKAKITAEAALRKVEKQRKEAEAATAQAAAIAKELEEGARQLEKITKKVEQAVRETEEKMREAEAYLQEVKKNGGVANGAIWWMEREIMEAKKYLPQRKQ